MSRSSEPSAYNVSRMRDQVSAFRDFKRFTHFEDIPFEKAVTVSAFVKLRMANRAASLTCATIRPCFVLLANLNTTRASRGVPMMTLSWSEN